jgi:hypothetical protein
VGDNWGTDFKLFFVPQFARIPLKMLTDAQVRKIKPLDKKSAILMKKDCI